MVAAPLSSPLKSPLWMRIAGWLLTVLILAGLTFSGVVKLSGVEDVVKEFERLGYPSTTKFIVILGIVELTCALLYAIPQTAVLGAILLTGYLGGATATHVRINDPFIPPVVMGVLMWLGLYFRDSRIRAILPFRW